MAKRGRPATGRVRKGTSIALSESEKARLLRWGPSASAAVRALLERAENAERATLNTCPIKSHAEAP
jgi:hypothetical protein